MNKSDKPAASSPSLREYAERILKIQEDLKEAVKEKALSEQSERLTRNRFLHSGIADLQDELRSAHTRDQGALLGDLFIAQSVASRTRLEPLPDLRFPYFCVLDIENQVGSQRTRSLILVGETALVSNEVKLINIDQSEYLDLLFNYEAGETFELERHSGHGPALRGKLHQKLFVRWDARGILVSFFEPGVFRPKGGEVLKIEDGQVGSSFHHKIPAGVRTDQGPGEKDASKHAVRRLLSPTDLVQMKEVLDEHQRAVLSEDLRSHMLITGSAGSGKTTVALMRLAHSIRGPGRSRGDERSHSDPLGAEEQHRCVVLVPEKGLRRWVMRMLDSVKLNRIQVMTSDDFVLKLCHSFHLSFQSKLCEVTPSVVLNIKRDPRIRELFVDMAEFKLKRLRTLVEKEFSFLGDLGRTGHASLQEWRELSGGQHQDSLYTRVNRLYEKLVRTVEDQTKSEAGRENWAKRLRSFYTKFWSLFFDFHYELAYLYFSPEAESKLGSIDPVRFSPEAIQRLRRHMTLQGNDPLWASQLQSGDGSAGGEIDFEYSVGVDSQKLESDDDLRGTIDVEDLVIGLCLFDHYCGGFWNPEVRTPPSRRSDASWRIQPHDLSERNRILQGWARLVIDEAQALSAHEVRVFEKALAQDGTLLLCGDIEQDFTQSELTQDSVHLSSRVDPSGVVGLEFENWKGLLSHTSLVLKHHHLGKVYRSPTTVQEWVSERLLSNPLDTLGMKSRHLSLGIESSEVLNTLGYMAVADSALVVERLGLFSDACMNVAFRIREIVRSEPDAHIAVLFSTREGALEFYDRLSSVWMDLRIAVDGDFCFEPGVDVCDVSSARGLEFDYVFVMKVTPSEYPRSTMARRRLYVAATRAVRQVNLVGDGPLLSEWVGVPDGA